MRAKKKAAAPTLRPQTESASPNSAAGLPFVNLLAMSIHFLLVLEIPIALRTMQFVLWHSEPLKFESSRRQL